MPELRIELSKNLKPKPVDESKLGFGNVFTDHMFMMDYSEAEGWHDARIIPYGPISLDPAAMVFHYAQEVFEGLKAYRAADGRILLFRPDQNFARLNRSNDRLCIPRLDEEFCIDCLKELIKVEEAWVPSAPGTSLYIRPFIIATDAHVGVHPAHNYYFIIILSPSGPYYAEGLNPVKIYVEDKYTRTVRGGTGEAKTGGNYAASLIAQKEASAQNYSQVLWLDGVEKKYIEEVGSMNIFFKIGDTVITPALQGSILPGITRKSVVEMLKSWGMKVEERRLAVDEVVEAARKGELKEVFGSGTAAVISPVGHLKVGDEVFEINNNEIGPLSQKLYDELTGIQWGDKPDPFGWSVLVK